MEFDIVGEPCKDFKNKEAFYARYPVDIVERVLVFLTPEMPDINEKFIVIHFLPRRNRECVNYWIILLKLVVKI